MFIKILDYETGKSMSLNLYNLMECYSRSNNIDPDDQAHPYLVVYKTQAGVLYYEGYADKASADARVRAIMSTGYLPNYQTKTVDPTKQVQVVEADEGYDALSDVTVNAVTSAIDQNITASNIKKNVNILGVTGNYEGEAPVLQNKTVTPTTSQQTVLPDANYDALSAVTVNGVTSAIDSNITASNIKKDVSILGVTGTLEGGEPNLQDKTQTISTNTTTTIQADEGYDGLGTVEVTTSVLPNLQEKVTDPPNPRFANTLEVTPDAGYDGLSKVTVNKPNLTSATVQSNQLSSTQEYYLGPYGSIVGYSSVTIKPVTSSIDSNIKAANIKSGVTILGVTGTMESADGLYNTGAILGLPSKFDIRKYIIKIPALFIAGTTDFSSAFEDYTSLTDCPTLDTSHVTNMSNMFKGCIALKNVPTLNTSSVTDMSNMFKGCTALKNVPILNTSSVTTMSTMFLNDKSLTDTSLDNILQMCINASSYTGTKTLATLGIIISAYYSQARIEALPHYQDFIAAGWTIN